MNTSDKFDQLLEAACEECCKREVEEFLNVDTTGFEISRREMRRFKIILRTNGKRSRVSVGRVIAAACLIALTVCITACVSIPKLRNAIKHVILGWNDKYVTVEFTESEPPADVQAGAIVPNQVEQSKTPTPLDDDTTKAPENSEIVKPDKIEKKAFASNLPEGYTSEVELDSLGYYAVGYYQGNEWIFSLSQKIITQHLTWADSEGQTIIRTEINGSEAILLKNTEENPLCMLLWQDNQYEYKIEGYFSNQDEILNIAKGVQLE